jgi:hypothetical protein
MPKEISSRCVVYGRCNAKADDPRLHSHLFNQNDDCALYDLCSNLSESSYTGLQFVGCYQFATCLIRKLPLRFDLPSFMCESLCSFTLS